MQRQSVARYLHVEGHAIFEPMLPIDRESQELDVELAGLGFVEDAQNGNRLEKGCVHDVPPKHKESDYQYMFGAGQEISWRWVSRAITLLAYARRRAVVCPGLSFAWVACVFAY